MNFKQKVKYTLYIMMLMLVLACSNSTNSKKKQTIEKDQIEEVNTLEENDKTSEKDSLSWGKIILIVLGSIVLSGGVVMFFINFVPLRLWYQARLSRVKVSWWQLIMMRWQKVPQELILQILIKARNGGLQLDAKDLVTNYLAGVNVDTVVNTLIRAHNAKLSIDLNDLAAQYLAKVDVEKVIHTLITAINANIELTINELASYYLANIDVERLIKAKIAAKNSGYAISLDELKQHYLAGGNIEKTVAAYVAAKKADLAEFEFSEISAIDLSGLDVTKAIGSTIHARVIETLGVTGVSRDGVQLTLKVKVTLRALIKGIVGGANEETVIARVNESLGTEIGMSESHFKVLESPFELADKVEQKKLDTDTGFEIMSIDVSEIQVGKDIHSELKMERAKAEAEMAKAEVIRAEEKVQKAMAAAFLDGKLTIHDYHNMMNTEADTRMRNNLGNINNNKDDNKNSHH